jgi:hypothetical protein
LALRLKPSALFGLGALALDTRIAAGIDITLHLDVGRPGLG